MIALSHSRLSDFNQCPLKFRLKYLDKAFPQEDESKNPHLLRGKNVHKQLENYIVKKRSGQGAIPVSTLPEVEAGKLMVDKFFTIFNDVLPEAQLAVDIQWKQVDWFSPNAYYRAIIDLIGISDVEALAGDWKTGKVNDYSGYGGQLHLTATMLMNVFPQYETVTTAYLYVDHKKSFATKFYRKEVESLTVHFDSESSRVNSEKDWPPTPNDFCGWCPATKAQCKHSRKL